MDIAGVTITVRSMSYCDKQGSLILAPLRSCSATIYLLIEDGHWVLVQLPVDRPHSSLLRGNDRPSRPMNEDHSDS
jgi:hypothetical protein